MPQQGKAPFPGHEVSQSGDIVAGSSALNWQNAGTLQLTLRDSLNQLCDASRKASQTQTRLRYEHDLLRGEYRIFFQCFDEDAFASIRRKKIKNDARKQYNEHQLRIVYKTVQDYMDSLDKEDSLCLLRDLNERYIRDYREYIICLSMYFLRAKDKIGGLPHTVESSVADVLHDFPFYMSGVILTVYIVLNCSMLTATSSAKKGQQNQESIQLSQIKASVLFRLLKFLDGKNLNKEIPRPEFNRHLEDMDMHAFFSYYEGRHKLHCGGRAITDRQILTSGEASLDEMIENEDAFRMQEGSTGLFGLHEDEALCPCSEDCRHDKEHDEIDPNIDVIDEYGKVDELGQTILASRRAVEPLIQKISQCLLGGAYEQVLLLYVKLIKELFPEENMEKSMKSLPAKLELQIAMLLRAWEEEGAWKPNNLNKCQDEILLKCPNEEWQRVRFEKQWYAVWKQFCSTRDSTISSYNFVHGYLFKDHKPTRALEELRIKIGNILGLELKVFQQIWEQMLRHQYRKETQWSVGSQAPKKLSGTTKRALIETGVTETSKKRRQERKIIAERSSKYRELKVTTMTQARIIADQQKRLKEQNKNIEERNTTMSEIVSHLKGRKNEGGNNTILEDAEQKVQNSSAPLVELFRFYHTILTEDLRAARESYKLQEHASEMEVGVGEDQLMVNQVRASQFSAPPSIGSEGSDRAETIQAMPTLSGPSDGSPKMDVDPRQQLAALIQQCNSMLSILQEYLDNRVKRIKFHGGSIDSKLENFIEHAKLVYRRVYEEEDSIFEQHWRKASFEHFEASKMRALGKVLQYATGALIPTPNETLEGSGDDMFNHLQQLCALQDSYSQNNNSTAQIQELRTEYNAFMSNAHAEATTDNQAYENQSSAWKLLESAISKLFKHIKRRGQLLNGSIN